MRLLLRAHGVGATLGGVPEARLLDDAAAALDEFDLPLDLVFERSANKAKTVYIFYFCFCPEFLLAARTHTYICVAAERAFLHVAVGDAGVEQNFLEPGEILVGLVRRADIGLGDNLDQRGAAAIEVDRGRAGRVRHTVMEALACVLFHVQAGDADAARPALGCGDIDPSMLGERLVELRDLVALGQVGIEIVLASKDRALADFGVDGLRRKGSKLDRARVEHRQRARQPQADGANQRVWRGTELVCAATKGLGAREQLDVDFKPDHRLVFC